MIIISLTSYPTESVKKIGKRLMELPSQDDYITMKGPYISSAVGEYIKGITMKLPKILIVLCVAVLCSACSLVPQTKSQIDLTVVPEELRPILEIRLSLADDAVAMGLGLNGCRNNCALEYSDDQRMLGHCNSFCECVYLRESGHSNLSPTIGEIVACMNIEIDKILAK